MGHSQAEKAESRARIVRAASARLRDEGMEALGIAGLMKEAGLTHGGFYGHFGSRDDLIAEAAEQALKEGSRAAFAIAKSKRAPIDLLVDGYLSVAHRDDRASGCAVTALAGDMPRGSRRARAAYRRQVALYLQVLGGLVPRGGPKAKRAKAIAALSALVGAVSLARAVDDEELSREILKATAGELKKLLKGP